MARVTRSLVFRVLRWAGAAFLGSIALFAVAGWIGSSISRNSDWREAAATETGIVEILVGTNGIHTEIAMPLVTPEMDWRGVFPASDIQASDRPYTHVSVSWGERAFFLETPTWSDLSLPVAVNAMTGGEAVLHVAHYVRPAPSSEYRILRLSTDEYKALTRAIQSHLPPPDEHGILPGYGSHDVFYRARGTYHIGNTCNQWTSDQLAAAGVKTGMWTPFPGGVMKWVPQLAED